MRRAIRFYERAVALDPAFATAWARLSRARSAMVTNGARDPELGAQARSRRRTRACVTAGRSPRRRWPLAPTTRSPIRSTTSDRWRSISGDSGWRRTTSSCSLRSRAARSSWGGRRQRGCAPRPGLGARPALGESRCGQLAMARSPSAVRRCRLRRGPGGRAGAGECLRALCEGDDPTGPRRSRGRPVGDPACGSAYRCRGAAAFVSRAARTCSGCWTTSSSGRC